MKKLQILRVDNDEVQKIDLQIGENIIGRSVTIACDDDRVIKQAVIINVKSDNEMTITPVTACYMKSIESSRWQLLKLGTTVPIKPGDVCSLLPKKCWFKIISVSSVMDKTEDYSLKRKANDDVESDMHEKRLCSELGEGDNFRSACNNESDKTANNNNFIGTPVEKDTSKDNSLVERDEKLIQEPCDMDKPSAMEEDDSKVQDEDRMSSEAAADDSTNMQENVELPSASKDNENDVAKDIEPSVPKAPADPEAVGSASASNNVIREKCKYGKDCYRRNTQHKAKFSHPGDSDYDTPDNREECPYGDKCYRKNAVHKMQYKHSSTSVAKGIGKRKRRKPQVQKPVDTLGAEDSSAEDLGEESDEESVDESEYEPFSDIESSNDDDDDDD